MMLSIEIIGKMLADLMKQSMVCFNIM